jgi:hypothetical protein
MILIADVGFGWDIYKDFMKKNKNSSPCMQLLCREAEVHRPCPCPPKIPVTGKGQVWKLCKRHY